MLSTLEKKLTQMSKEEKELLLNEVTKIIVNELEEGQLT